MVWSLTVPLVALAAYTARSAATTTPRTATNAQTSYTLLYQNNLNATDDANHIGAILLDANTQLAGSSACTAVGESLITQAAVKAHS
jgi:hypothetical protein